MQNIEISYLLFNHVIVMNVLFENIMELRSVSDMVLLNIFTNSTEVRNFRANIVL